MYDWGLLSISHLYKEIINEWILLLNEKTKKEQDYHHYISQFPKMFFNSLSSSPNIVISKLKLGADYEVDFVNCNDNRSDGIIYQIIEIESPHSPPFNKNGNPSARLTGAIQQINDWKLWIDNNNEEAKRLFPTISYMGYGIKTFKYTIIIGNRENSKEFIHKRLQLSQNNNIKIRSFDWLTENLINQGFLTLPNISISQYDNIDDIRNNAISNPFFYAISSSVWNKIVKNPIFKPFHFIYGNIDLLLENCKVNEEYCNRFLYEVKNRYTKKPDII